MRYTVLSLSLIALLAAPAAPAFAQQHVHPAPAPSTTRAKAPAKGYTTDATLRQQMRAIRTDVAAIGNAQQRDASRPVTEGASRIIDHVNTIIVNCKLPADADAALHEIIGPILQHASALKSDPGKADAVAGIRQSLDRYAREFDDPGFAKSKE